MQLVYCTIIVTCNAMKYNNREVFLQRQWQTMHNGMCESTNSIYCTHMHIVKVVIREYSGFCTHMHIVKVVIREYSGFSQ